MMPVSWPSTTIKKHWRLDISIEISHLPLLHRIQGKTSAHGFQYMIIPCIRLGHERMLHYTKIMG